VTRRLSKEEAAAALGRAVPIASERRVRQPRSVLQGLDPLGAVIEARLVGASLVVFLSTTCDGCRDLAGLVREGVEGFDVLGVLRVPTDGLPDDGISSFVGTKGRWILGDDAFEAFEVRAAPFFCILDATGSLGVEGVALAASHVADHCARVLAGPTPPGVLRPVAEDG
jgi:hypothetical protein